MQQNPGRGHVRVCPPPDLPPKFFWGLYFEEVCGDNCDMVYFTSRFFGGLAIAFGTAGVLAPDCTGTAIMFLVFMFTSMFECLGVFAGFYGDGWTAMWYLQIVSQVVFLTLALIQYNGSAGVTNIASGRGIDQVNINKFLAICFLGYAVFMIGTPSDFLALYWDEATALKANVTVLTARVSGLAMLAMAVGGLLDPKGDGPTTTFAVGNCITLLTFVFIFFNAFGKQWTALWYPQMVINAFYATIAVISYMKGPGAQWCGKKPQNMTAGATRASQSFDEPRGAP